ncbi:imidazoleglycerol-phosphate dehydratase [Candidatus Nasuia deltocephalinicola]|uniref:Imidazoleglycerol-phosphate dehydratase n=1 Tax=Candidatus Nasuia deltocephalincola TaxID=1160784 RepID=A0A975A357_9PROT|nr:imidazoleglycerol-phosphate dehydratase [Candidatus Nasuia deltocephalinicola]WKD87120.1 imidazoleglycerol-phosphate dehydratase [Candidatus Nasuia deltocephalinicola]BEH03964.1 imidazoleglycerol-phosphate dehydratase [Candidatus Nasuia deltocephalinicola]
MYLYEFFRKTLETYICSQIYLNYEIILKKNIINIDISYLKHMIDQFLLNSWINLNLNSIGDLEIDYHHMVEDLGISIGKIFNFFLPKNKKFYLNRYGSSYVPLDESLSRVVLDICGRSYLSYNVFYYNMYIKNFNINLFYDFFLSFTNNSLITIYIDNIIGFNIHHIFETIFKSFGLSLRISLKLNRNINTSKKIIF